MLWMRNILHLCTPIDWQCACNELESATEDNYWSGKWALLPSSKFFTSQHKILLNYNIVCMRVIWRYSYCYLIGLTFCWMIHSKNH